MFQRDYFMRMIAEMTEAIGQLLKLRQERKQEEALLVIDELLDTKFRLSSKLIRSLSDEDLIKMMTTNGILETDHLQAIAILLKHEADLNAELGREDESFYAYVKSLHLFIRLSLADADPTLVEPRTQINELLERLQPFEMPLPTKRLLMEWLEEEGRFASVENLMHELIEDKVFPLKEAEEVYRRIMLLTDERLEAGGLPREEIKQAMEELKK